MIFTFAISVFGLVSGTVGKFTDEFGCLSEFKGILTFWKNLDLLFTLVEIGLCDPIDCPCYMTSEAQKLFEKNVTTIDYIIGKSVKNIDHAISFDNCTNLKSYVQIMIRLVAILLVYLI